jgi:hypothetical protein
MQSRQDGIDIVHGHRWLAALMIVSALLLAGCGTTSSLKAAGGTGSVQVPELSAYARLLVSDFQDEASEKAKPKVKPLVTPKIQAAQKLFADQIAAVTTAAGGFSEVLRTGGADASTLVLRGAITQYDEGDATLRLLIGFGAGNVNFDARVELYDGGTGNLIGSWLVDKNSWALGGAVAAGQRPEDFMQQAAAKIGTELSAARRGKTAPK